MWYEISFVTVRGTDFGTKLLLVRYEIRILVQNFVGTERGPKFGTQIFTFQNPYHVPYQV